MFINKKIFYILFLFFTYLLVQVAKQQLSGHHHCTCTRANVGWPWQHKMTLNTDQHLISPYSITPESHFKLMRIKEMIINFKLIDALLFWFSWYVLASFWPVLNQNISTFLCISYKHSWAYFFSGGSLTTSGLGGSGLKNSQQDSFDCTPVQQLVGFYNKSHQFMYPVRALYRNSSQS